MTRIVTKIYRKVMVFAISAIAIYGMDKDEFNFHEHNFIKVRCTFTDWMPPLARNIFYQRDFIDQHYIRSKIIQHSLEIADLMGGTKEDKEKMSLYLRQIANDENPINDNPLLVMGDKNHPHYKVANTISMVLYKILTGQVVIMDGKLMNSKVFSLINKQ